MRSITRSVVLASAVLAAARIGVATTVYTVTNITPTGSIYTNPSTNAQYVSGLMMNGAGAVAGLVSIDPVVQSFTVSSSGQNAFYYNPLTQKSTIIDLTSISSDPEYVNATGYANASLSGLSSTGYAGGTNPIYLNGAQNGSDAWVYTPATTANGVGTTTLIPVLNAPNTVGPPSINNIHVMNVTGVSNSGVVVGSAILYGVGYSSYTYTYYPQYLGMDAYVYSAAKGTSQLTINNAADTSADGSVFYTTSTGAATFSIKNINGASQVAGTASAYDSDDFSLGQDAWYLDASNGNTFATLISPAATVNGVNYTQDGTETGLRQATVVKLSATGDVIGQSSRYVNGQAAGTDVWLYDGAQTRIIGLTGAPYLANNTLNASANAGLLSNNGIAGGTDAVRNSGNVNVITDAWIYQSPASTSAATPASVRVGLVGAGYQMTGGTVDGYRTSSPNQMGVNGQMAGTTLRYDSNNAAAGQDAWFVDGNAIDPTNPNSGIAGTKLIGLNASTGYPQAYYQTGSTRYSVTQFVNALGQVAGYSYRYNAGGSQVGQDAFVYDPTQHADYAITLSTSSDGVTASSNIVYLSDTGVALGYYTKYNGSTALPGTYGFAWRLVNGVPTTFDFNSATSNLTADGWSQLFQGISSDLAGDVLGYGQLTGYTGMSNGNLTSLSAFLEVSHLLGDANGDGRVDLSDLNTVLNHLGATDSSWADGNFDGAATIDLTDLNDVLNNLGVTASGGEVTGALSQTVSAVPEPASMGILALAGMALLRRRRRPR